MGIEIIRPRSENSENITATPHAGQYANLTFQEYSSNDPQMFIWLMLARQTNPLLPWWTYDYAHERDIQTLSEVWTVTSAESFFDCLFLSCLRRFAGPNFFGIFPGNIKKEPWAKVRETDKNTFLRGQGCVYHLQGHFDHKLNINWVPFWQPQSVVKDPVFSNLWRLFVASRGEESDACFSFFSLADSRNITSAIPLLINETGQRSQLLSQATSWFGMYTSPNDEKHSPCAVIYTQKKEQLDALHDLERLFRSLFEQAQNELKVTPKPSTALRFLSRYVPL